MGRRSVEGESVSEPVVTADGVVFAETWAIDGFVASLGSDSLTSVDRRLVALMDETGWGVVSGDTMTVKKSVTGWIDCSARLSLLVRVRAMSTPEMFS